MRGSSLLAVAGLLVVGALALPGTTRAATTVSTTEVWNGYGAICPFGRPNSATYGQVVTVPSQSTVLDSFSFYVQSDQRPTTIALRGELYAWDGAKATGPSLWESPVQTIAVSAPAWQELTFNPGGVSLTAGQRYVLFASVSKDYEANGVGNTACWGFLQPVFYPDTYSGGCFVYLNNGDDESQWTNTTWAMYSPTCAADLAFRASFSAAPTSKDQCKNGGWRTYGVFKNEGDCVSFIATGGKNPPAGSTKP